MPANVLRGTGQTLMIGKTDGTLDDHKLLTRVKNPSHLSLLAMTHLLYVTDVGRASNLCFFVQVK